MRIGYRVETVECYGGENLVSLIAFHGRYGDDFTPAEARALARELVEAANAISCPECDGTGTSRGVFGLKKPCPKCWGKGKP